MPEETSTEVVEGTVEAPVETVVETPEVIEEDPSNQPEEAPEEPPRLYAGRYNSVEELEKAVIEKEKYINSTRKAEPELPPDKKRILDELKSYGVVTASDLKQHQAGLTQQAKDDAEIAKLGLSASQEQALRRYSQHPDNVHKSMTGLWSELGGLSGGKVVKRTVLKPKNSAKTSEFKVLSQSEAAALPTAEYKAYWVKYRAHKAGS